MKEPEHKPKIGDRTVIDGTEYVFLQTTGKPDWHSPEQIAKYKQQIQEKRDTIHGIKKAKPEPQEQQSQPPERDDISRAITKRALEELAMEEQLTQEEEIPTMDK